MLPADLLAPLAGALLGLALVGGGVVTLRTLGARPALASRFAGARELRVGDLPDLEQLPERPVRVVGRVRCDDPLVSDRGERLVAVHRDVEVRLGRDGWQSIERLRETRSFELWDHDGSVTIDPSLAAEPLISIPHVWQGRAEELDESYAPALARLAVAGAPPTQARAVTRMLPVVDRMHVLALVERSRNGRIALTPPEDGYVIAAVELDEAMRLLGGSSGRRTGLAMVGIALGAVIAVVGGTLLGIALLR